MTKEALNKKAEEYTKSVINVDGFDWKIVREICFAYIAGHEAGFKDCAKARLNVTTISDCPIKDDELEKENAELKEKLTAIRNAKDKYDKSEDKSTIKALGAEYTLFCDLERILEDWQEDNKLTRAKELLKQFLDADTNADLLKAQWHAEQFLKDNEVEE